MVSTALLELTSFFAQDGDGQVHGFYVCAKAQDGETQGEATVDHGRGDEDASVSLHGVYQLAVEGVGVTPLREVAERHDREVRRGSDLEAAFAQHLLVAVACEE